ncbi:MAG: hypothetical protein PHS02_03790 [Candidatus ainarchaeum sp.]|nr:hypothetical protein [Candidatus ainarchaeum sp.]
MNGFGKKKGQAAIEYLMTYGWALLVIAIVIVALYVIMQNQVRSDKCIASTGFTCDVPQVYVDSSGNAFMSVRFYNDQLQGIKVKKVTCTTNPSNQADPALVDLLSPPQEIPNGFNGNFTMACKNGATPVKFAAGQQFNGYLIVWYNYDNDPNPDVFRKTDASASTTVVKST